MGGAFANSIPMADSMGGVLADITGITSASEREWLLGTLVTAAEFYCRGRDVGYREGLMMAKKENR